MRTIQKLQPLTNWLRKRPQLGRLALKCMPDTRLTINIDPIGPFHVRLRRNRSFWLRDPLTHERIPLGALQRLIRPGSVVYDVGANLGMYARFMVSEFKAGKVVGFEPMTENRELLQANIKVGALEDRVAILPYALSENNGEEDLQVDDMMSGSAVLNIVSGGKPSQGRLQYGLPAVTEKVVVRTLDRLVAEKRFELPDVIKIDIEGAEGLMLKGAVETLMQARPDLVVELHGVEAAQSVFSTLDKLGYACYGDILIGEKREYLQITRKMIDGLRDYYDLHFLIASFEPLRIKDPIECYEVQPKSQNSNPVRRLKAA